MKVRILPLEIVKQIETEDNLLELCTLESIYEIRALKVAVELADKDVEIDKQNNLGQIYIDSHEIWLQPNTWKLVKG